MKNYNDYLTTINGYTHQLAYFCSDSISEMVNESGRLDEVKAMEPGEGLTLLLSEIYAEEVAAALIYDDDIKQVLNGFTLSEIGDKLPDYLTPDGVDWRALAISLAVDRFNDVNILTAYEMEKANDEDAGGESDDKNATQGPD